MAAGSVAEPRRVDADGTHLQPQPTVQRRRGDGERRFPQRVDVLARGGKEECAGAHPDTTRRWLHIGFGVRLGDARVAVLRLVLLGAGDQMNVSVEVHRGAPVRPQVELRRRRAAAAFREAARAFRQPGGRAVRARAA